VQKDPTLNSRRSITLRFDIPIGLTRDYWDALKAGRFITTMCKNCGHISYPPQADCPECGHLGPSWVDLPREARLVTFTYVVVTPSSFANHEPYLVAIGELDNGLKVLAWLEGLAVQEAKPGMRLRVETRTSKEGNAYPVFVPI
jgi:uncharacterized OB-fold protein